MLKVHNLTKTFGNNKAVSSVSFEIERGDIFSLIGPNSSGKTTIVKSILGLLEPTGGYVEVDGHKVESHPEKTKAQIGYIPDEPSIWSYMTGKEFLLMTQALFGIPKEKRIKKVADLLPIFSLNGIENNYFDDYSRGNKQKFSILSALSHEPSLLVIDEPIVGLDPEGATIAKQLFVDHAKKNNGTVLLVTHTLPVAQEISTKIGVLKHGHLLAVGSMDELREKAGLHHDATLDEVYTALVITK
jgi:ABC-2 type transport system ATP-binding protein